MIKITADIHSSDFIILGFLPRHPLYQERLLNPRNLWIPMVRKKLQLGHRALGRESRQLLPKLVLLESWLAVLQKRNRQQSHKILNARKGDTSMLVSLQVDASANLLRHKIPAGG